MQKNDAALHAYLAQIEQVRSLLATLTAQVDAHQDALDPEAMHWGHVGDMTRLAAELETLVHHE